MSNDKKWTPEDDKIEEEEEEEDVAVSSVVSPPSVRVASFPSPTQIYLSAIKIKKMPYCLQFMFRTPCSPCTTAIRMRWM